MRFILLLRSNWITLTGAIITTLSFLSFVTTFALISLGIWYGPYLGLVTFLVLPAFFIIGILVIPLGLLIYRKELAKRIELLTHKPFRLLRTIGFLTLINIAVVSLAGYEGLHYMDSTEFCGKLCHEVMSPTYDSYVSSPHARVKCVECHIGPGASWFVKSKLSGLRQVLAVLFDTYQRPIPTPVHDLRPARETCEQCHWPDKFTGDRLVVRQHFREDEANSPFTNILVMKTGGTRPDGKATGIHWHIHPGNKVSYISIDDKRTKIPWIKLEAEDGTTRVFTTDGTDPEHPPAGTLRTMDCVDCHNQPSHEFEDPGKALDRALASGLIPRDLPFIKKFGMDTLRRGWTRNNVVEGIREHIRAFYADRKVEDGGGDLTGQIDAAAEVLADIWKRNVFPAMGITWGTYPTMEAHAGCMRCHDGQHTDAEGDEISMDCENCHAILAQKESEPEILEQLGLKNQ